MSIPKRFEKPKQNATFFFADDDDFYTFCQQNVQNTINTQEEKVTVTV